MSTASTAMYTTPSLVPESPMSNENASSDSLQLTMTPSPKSSVKPSRSSSGANAHETRYLDMKGKTTIDFVDYANQHIRPIMIQDFERFARYASSMDMESYWQEIVMMIWTKAIVADDFETIHNFTAWCFSFMKKYHAWTRESDFMRGTHSTKSEMMFNTFFMTDIQDEVLNRTITRASKHKHREVPQLGKSHGWLSDALDKMTERERTSILSVKVVGMTRKETADILNTTECSVRCAVKTARKKILKFSPEHLVPLAATRQ